MDPYSRDAPGQGPDNIIDLTHDAGEADDLDEDHKDATYLSLRKDSELEEDDNDDDVRVAIALSLQSANEILHDPPISTTRQGNEGGIQDKYKEVTSSKMSYGIPGLDRRRDEEARLQRLKRKREASISPPALSRNSTTLRPSPSNNVSNEHSAASKTLETQAPASSRNTCRPSLQYPDGMIKKTWVLGYPRLGDIKFEELLQRESLQAAVLSSFQWNMEWLFSKLDTARTKIVLVMQAQTKDLQDQYRAETAVMKNLRLCFPPMDGQVFCMHSKLMLLFYENRLRIAIPTANLTDYDWGEMGGVMENSCFVIDLPKLHSDVHDINFSPSTDFQINLLYFLTAQNMQTDVVEKINLFDFRKTARLGFVHSIGGSHTHHNWRKTGFCGLGVTLQRLGLETALPISVDYIASSIGSLNANFLRSMYLAGKGDDGLVALHVANKLPKNSGVVPSRQITKDDGSGWEKNMRVYYPSKSTVESSKGGPDCAGTVCFQQKWYNAQFPKQIMRDCVSSRPGLLMHNKVCDWPYHLQIQFVNKLSQIMYIRLAENIRLSDDKNCRSWVYVGSANLSESAWGKLIYAKGNRELKLSIRNWECGVVFPITEIGVDRMQRSDEDLQKVSITEDTLSDLASVVPIPIQLPGQRYGTNSPWFSSL